MAKNKIYHKKLKKFITIEDFEIEDILEPIELNIFIDKLTVEFIIKRLKAYYEIDNIFDLEKELNIKIFKQSKEDLHKYCMEQKIYNKIFIKEEILKFKKNIENEAALKTNQEIQFLEYSRYLTSLLEKGIDQLQEDDNKKLQEIKNFVNEKKSKRIEDKFITILRTKIKKLQKRFDYKKENEESQKKTNKMLEELYENKEQQLKLIDEKNKKLSIQEITDNQNKSLKDSKYSNTLIEVQSNEFNSSKSREAIGNTYLNELNIPIDIGTIIFIYDEVEEQVNFEYANTYLFFKIKDFTLNLDTKENNRIINELVEDTPEQEKNLILDSLSIFTFISFFNDDKEKVIKERIIKKNFKNDAADKKTKNEINIIKLRTLESNEYEKKYITADVHKNSKWLVRGHWRRLKRENKIRLIWISPFWKGKGNKLIKKKYLL